MGDMTDDQLSMDARVEAADEGPTTPTGKRLHVQFPRNHIGPHSTDGAACAGCATIKTIEREAAAAERERLGDVVHIFRRASRDPDTLRCRWCDTTPAEMHSDDCPVTETVAVLADPEDTP